MEKFVKDCHYLLGMLQYANGKFEYEEIRKIVDMAVNVFNAASEFGFTGNEIFKKLVDVFTSSLRANRKFRSQCRDEYYSLSNGNRSKTLEEII